MVSPTASRVQLRGAARRLDHGKLGRWLPPLLVAVPLCIVAIALEGFQSGFPTSWYLGVPEWFDRLDQWVTNNESTSFFLHTIIGGFGNFLNSATNDIVSFLHWLTWLGVLAVATAIAWLVGTWKTA